MSRVFTVAISVPSARRRVVTEWLCQFEKMAIAKVDDHGNLETHSDASPGDVVLANLKRGKSRDGRLETRSVLRIVRELGQSIGLHVWCHGLRHTAITTAIDKGQQAGIGLDRIRAFSRHRTLATMLVYRDEHDRSEAQRTLADVVASTLRHAVWKDLCPTALRYASSSDEISVQS
jgi:integrase/recombinase XerC